MQSKKLPVTVVSGFLGAGKTTMVNHLLAENPAVRFGIIVNEFGEVGIDGELIIADANPLIEIRNGCVCCTVRADLVEAIKTLLSQHGDHLDRLIVETSGLADPAPVLQTFLADADLLEQVELESVITLVDAVNLMHQRDDQIAQEQIAFADLIILNKTAEIVADQLPVLERDLRGINPTAAIVRANHAALPGADLLGVPRFSLPTLLAIEPGLLEDEHEHEHDDAIAAFAVETQDPLDPQLLNRWLNGLVQRDGERLLRMKGVAQFIGEARKFYFHSVHMLLDGRPGKAWETGMSRSSRFVFIGRELDRAALTAGFMACTAQAVPALVA